MPKGVPILTLATAPTPAAKKRIQERIIAKQQTQAVIMRQEKLIKLGDLSISRINKLANGESLQGKIKTLDKNGNSVEIDVEVPAAVQLRANEILLNRAFGKDQEHVHFSSSGDASTAHALSIMERIAALKQAMALKGQTTDLEASEVTEVPAAPVEIVVSPAPATSAPAPVSALDLI